MSQPVDMSVAGDDDRWMLLQRQSDSGQPMVIRTRLNVDIREFATSSEITAVICEIDPELVDEHGMPTCMEALYELEDSLVALVDDSGRKAFHTASATGDSRRTMYFAHSSEAVIEDIASAISADVATIWCSSQLGFDTYDGFVSPTAVDTQIDGDHRLFSSLRDSGDNGEKSRKIDFWFYGEKAALEDLASRLSDLDMSVDQWLDDDRFGMVMSQNAPATIEHFAALTPILVEASLACAVEYDGWGTPVVSEQPIVTPTEPKTSLFGRLFGKRNN